MNVTLSLDDDLVRKIRKIAVDRDTTLTGMIRDYLEQVATEESAGSRRRRERELLERSFREVEFKMDRLTWRRADLYERS